MAGFERAWEKMGPTFDKIISQVMEIFDSLGKSLGTTDGWADVLGNIAEFQFTNLLVGIAAFLQVATDVLGIVVAMWKAYKSFSDPIDKSIEPLAEDGGN